MAFSDVEEARISLIEDILIDLMTAVNNLASKQQMRQITLLRQTEITDLTTRITELERLIALLQQRIA
jgi:polyhydroxyalkanoate synthesis regulator phasin